MSEHQFHEDGIEPPEGQIFCFGSNLLGAHGKGAALLAKQRYGALYGQAEGHMTDLRSGRSCYAIPTKDRRIMTLPLAEIEKHVSTFITYAKEHPEHTFFMTRIGCVLAGYKDSQIAPLFTGAPANIIFPEQWEIFLKADAKSAPKP